MINNKDLPDILNPRKVLFFVGHTETGKGASAYNGQSEYEYNLLVRDHFREHLLQKRIKLEWAWACRLKDRVHFLPYNFKEFSKSFKGTLHETLLIELHFNSFGRRAEGRETLVRERDQKLFKERFEKDYLEDLYKRLDENIYPSKRRGLNGIRWIAPGSRGYWNLESVGPLLGTNSLATIFEPEFLSHQGENSSPYINHPERYANQLLNWAQRFVGLN